MAKESESEKAYTSQPPFAPKIISFDDIDEIARVAHFGQVDKLGVDYVEHPRAVSSLVSLVPGYADLSLGEQWSSIAAALLHDVLEDTVFTSEDLKRMLVPEPVIKAVELLTKGSSLQGYYEGIYFSRVARVVKIADMSHNCDKNRLAQISDEAMRLRLQKKYLKGIEILARNYPEDREWFRGRTDV